MIDLVKLPLGLYGVAPDQKKQTILPDRPQKLDSGKCNKRQRAWLQSTETLLMVLNYYCILPPLSAYDNHLNQKAKYGTMLSEDIEHVQARTILRGAAMNALVVATRGNESILASAGAYNLLVSPWKYFRVSPKDRVEAIAASVMKDTDTTILGYAQALAAHFMSNQTLLSSIDECASLIRENVFGQAVPTASKTKSRQPQQKRTSTLKKLKDCGPTSIQDIISLPNQPPSLLPIGAILREACNRFRDFPAADEILSRVLNGKSPTGQQLYPPEQTDPVRGDNVYTQLLLKTLPPNKLTTRQGISALLAYMGTGQCTATHGFLWDNPDIFWEYKNCVNAFETARSENDSVYNSNPMVMQAKAAGKKHKKFIPGMKRYEFSQVWGQPCCHLSVQGGIKERFQPIFEPAIQDRWEEWLGSLLNKDPALVTSAEKRPWKDALEFVQSLGIKGFASGLTPLQFANNLKIAGIVADPSAPDMVSWLYINRELGATKGLQYLGFQPKTFRGFLAAFLVVHDHLDEHLSADDKSILHFGVIFTEHLLCKISRWRARLRSEDRLNPEVKSEWIKGANATNHLAFPVPETILTQHLETVVQKTNVCTLLQLPIQILIIQQAIEIVV